MVLTYPSKWAEAFNFKRDRVGINQAIEFVEAVQTMQFGSIVEMAEMNENHSRNPENDPVLQSEKELNENIGEVTFWLKELRENGQQTISTSKVQDKIEDETGMTFKID